MRLPGATAHKPSRWVEGNAARRRASRLCDTRAIGGTSSSDTHIRACPKSRYLREVSDGHLDPGRMQQAGSRFLVSWPARSRRESRNRAVCDRPWQGRSQVFCDDGPFRQAQGASRGTGVIGNGAAIDGPLGMRVLV